MKVSLDAIKALRERTSASLNDVREALISANGDEAKAIQLLRERGASMAKKRSGRATEQGRVETYAHHDGRLGAVVEVNCETDFVARTPQFLQFCRDVVVHVAAMSPDVVRKDDLSEGSDAGQLVCLLDQPFVKDQGATVGDMLNGIIATTGENIVIRRFARFGLGEAAS